MKIIAWTSGLMTSLNLTDNRHTRRFFSQVSFARIMKRAAEYTGIDDNGVPLKKHDEDPDTRIARIRDEIVAKHQSIASLHADLQEQ
jgi:hypothetical protein